MPATYKIAEVAKRSGDPIAGFVSVSDGAREAKHLLRGNP